MTCDEWIDQYGELVRDRDTQAQHVASLLKEWTAEKEKLDRLELALLAWMDKAPGSAQRSDPHG